MTSLHQVLDWYRFLRDSNTITSDLLKKSTKGGSFRGTVFLNRQLDEVKATLQDAQRELSDLAIVSLVAEFEKQLAAHLGEHFTKLHAAVSELEPTVSPAVFDDVQKLCDYRDWVSHGRRWTPPAYADPELAYTRLSEFLRQSRIQ